jgi:2-polyprenyl-3-methyl-5-hydroxy-6-metoxy-1,4-benzoquinol methylase
MSTHDEQRWDERYRSREVPLVGAQGSTAPPAAFANVHHLFGLPAMALDLACGDGSGAVWLAQQGWSVTGFDVSGVAIDLANQRAAQVGLADHCHFERVDLDDGLPPGPLVDLITCHMFRDPRLDDALIARLRPGGVLAIAALSESGGHTGSFHSPAGALRAAFDGYNIVASRDADGVAVVVVRR